MTIFLSVFSDIVSGGVKVKTRASLKNLITTLRTVSSPINF